MTAILVIDDERGIRALCGDVLGKDGHEVETADCAAAALAAVGRRAFDLILCDINLPDVDGVSLLPRLFAPRPGAEAHDAEGGASVRSSGRSGLLAGAAGEATPPTVILITAYPSIDTAVRGLKLGARDYLAKPFSPDELRLVVGRALEEDALRRQHRQLKERLAWGQLVGDSPPMAELRRTVERVAASDATVLVTGESGTGKELVARALHFAGPRAARSFVPVNCGALVGTLLDSELFGHVRGAFTGADTAKRGLFVAADRGSLFLDEIGELPLELQPKLLRAIQDGEIKPVGGHASIQVDTRLIAATNRDLREEIGAGRFREDLYYRLAVITIEVPPLRARRGDIAPLARHFADEAAARAHRGRVELAPEAMAWLEQQPWPGNVRELENTVERAVVLAAGDTLGVDDVRPRAAPPTTPTLSFGDHVPTLDELERAHILHVLALCQGQKTRAAAMLGINRTTLWKKLRQYGLE